MFLELSHKPTGGAYSALHRVNHAQTVKLLSKQQSVAVADSSH